MGSLSLERVQFKFASIIGELCSEPLLLSQFAVWLDIKLAEYKAKGSISLDCSGEKPEPPWMKGILPPSPDSLPSGLFEVKNDPAETLQTKSPFRSAAQNTSKQSYSASRMQHAKSSSAQSFNPETVTSRLSSGDDIIVIKEEDDNSVAGYYNPSGAYSNISGQPTSQSTFLDSYTESAAQKRLSTDNILNVGQPSPKVGRFAAPSAAGSPSSVSSLSNPSTSREVTGYDPNSSEDRLQPPDSNADSWLGQVTAERDIDTSDVSSAAF